jgi:hypothetical protein
LSKVFSPNPPPPLPQMARVRTKSKPPPVWAVVVFFAVCITSLSISAYVQRYTGPESFRKVTPSMTLAEMEAVIGKPAAEVVPYVAANGQHWVSYEWRSDDGRFALSADFPNGGTPEIILEEDGGTRYSHTWHPGERYR